MPVTGVQQFPEPIQMLTETRQAVDPQTIQHPTSIEQAFEPNGIRAAAARGTNVYMGGLPYAPGAGRPRNPQLNFGNGSDPQMQAALQRKIAQYGIETKQHEARKGRL